MPYRTSRVVSPLSTSFPMAAVGEERPVVVRRSLQGACNIFLNSFTISVCASAVSEVKYGTALSMDFPNRFWKKRIFSPSSFAFQWHIECYRVWNIQFFQQAKVLFHASKSTFQWYLKCDMAHLFQWVLPIDFERKRILSHFRLCFSAI